MNIKPINDTSTINFISNSEQMQRLRLQSFDEKDETDLPNGLYRVFRFEKTLNIIMLTFSLLVFFAATALILVNAFKTEGLTSVQEVSDNPIIFVYIVGGAIVLLSGLKITSVLIDLGAIKKSMENYRASMKAGNASIPRYIDKLYRRLVVSQVDHNGITIFLVGFGGIFAAILYGLKGADGSIGTNGSGHIYIPVPGNVGIKNAFVDPDLVVTLFVIILAAGLILHIVFALIRKKRKVDIESFFVKEDFISEDTIQSGIRMRRKIGFRSFLIINIILILVPIAYIIYRVIKSKRTAKALI